MILFMMSQNMYMDHGAKSSDHLNARNIYAKPSDENGGVKQQNWL
jgi:hypothetical protein